jgi:hypothetical protein
VFLTVYVQCMHEAMAHVDLQTDCTHVQLSPSTSSPERTLNRG